MPAKAGKTGFAGPFISWAGWGASNGGGKPLTKCFFNVSLS